ncbi:MAG: 5-methyltetrahydropteroyltriglutamate--homocysteine S-methyltransferase [Bifidobacteriaceae bacterium]|jgi:5-methyltetrahydropteroyltriglutamate--homocysteine methyltransferase|nr:5-methyltetrahydropteroyltriglutamate--homocysteine S-methyltransferase [Bifidobacteriaceae bacterium]
MTIPAAAASAPDLAAEPAHLAGPADLATATAESADLTNRDATATTEPADPTVPRCPASPGRPTIPAATAATEAADPTSPGRPSGTGRGGDSPGATCLGYPRQGANRELKRAVEGYWSGAVGAADLLKTARELRLGRIATMREAGLAEVPSNDFSLYDHVLDTAWMLGAIPPRFAARTGTALDRYFALARGGDGLEPLEMTKWFDTNYHYLVPELTPDTLFALDPSKPLAEFDEAKAVGVTTRPVILGPVSFLLLSKTVDDAAAPVPASAEFQPLDLLDRLLPEYQDLLARLAEHGAEWAQLDEPCLVLDQPAEVLERVRHAYDVLTEPTARPQLLVATYFGALDQALPVLAASPVEGLAIDFTGPASKNLEDLERIGGIPRKRVVAGLIDGRNIWAADLELALAQAESLTGLSARLDPAASCSLLHVPLDVNAEAVPGELAGWFAFARQKLDEAATLARGLTEGRPAVAEPLRANAEARRRRDQSPLTRVDAIRARVASVNPGDARRANPRRLRAAAQAAATPLPQLPTTTIGSFPQTAEVRSARAARRKGTVTQAEYEAAMRAEIAAVVRAQEELGLDVLVHGEPERNDMVQYFAEQLDGFWTSENGWVQSYGSRYVRPPILFGDVSRPEPMTVRWTGYAQSLTDRPVKGMLTGPVTMLAWSFVRDDQPLADTAAQVALALRDEVLDLERSGARIIQVDEPALRELLPLRRADRPAYLDWAVRAFALTTAAVGDSTQLHTHMCYAEFGDIVEAIIAMDPDVISLEAARSGVGAISGLARGGDLGAVGAGVWDIHSPRVPPVEEVAARIRLARATFGPDAWVNPDCGLKTRSPGQTRAALANLVEAARLVRTAQ